MTRRIVGFCWAMALAGCSVQEAGSVAAAHGEPEPPPVDGNAVRLDLGTLADPQEVSVQLRVRESLPGSADVFRQTETSARDTAELAVGQSRSLLVATACGSATAGGEIPVEAPPPATKRYEHVWVADVTRGTAELGRVRLQVRLRHWIRDAEGRVEEAPSRERTVVLTEGSAHVLDFRPEADGDGPRCGRGTHVDLFAEPVEDATRSDRSIGFDIWYAHEDETGRQARRLVAAGRDGETLDLAFARVRTSVPGSADPPRALGLDLRGTVRGRHREDGTVELVLTTRRDAVVLDASGRATPYASRRATEAWALQPGRTVKLPLPALSPGVGVGADPAAAALDEDDELVEAIGEHEDALIVTVSDGAR